MSTKLVIAAALIGALAASPALALEEGDAKYNPPSKTEAADQTLGMALMSVSVLAGCDTFRGSGATSISNPGLGVCRVTFDRNVRNCSIVTSVGGFGAAVVDGLAQTNYLGGAANDNVVEVETRDNSDSPASVSFHVIVFCTQ